jgi:hypothetical protein
MTIGRLWNRKFAEIIAEESAKFEDPESVADRFDELVDSVESLNMNVNLNVLSQIRDTKKISVREFTKLSSILGRK